MTIPLPAIYNLPKLTNQRTLSNFWNHPGKVDLDYARYFRQELIDYSQLNGSFYGNSPWMFWEMMSLVNVHLPMTISGAPFI